MFSPVRLAFATCLSTLALACASAAPLKADAPSAADMTPTAANVQPAASGSGTEEAAASGIYMGTIGANDNVVLTLHSASPRGVLTGSYHHARGWNQEVYELSGRAQPGNALALRTGGNRALRAQGGRFEGSASTDGKLLTGTWIAADGSRKPFALTRAASWEAQSVIADGGVRSCERPRFSDTRYERVNRELAEACDYFLADGAEGPGKLRLEIDSLGQYMVAAVAYAENRGRELPPEVIAIDLGGPDESAQVSAVPGATTIATRP